MSFYCTIRSWWYRSDRYIWKTSLFVNFFLSFGGKIFSAFCWWTSKLDHFLFLLYQTVLHFFLQYFFLTILPILNPYWMEKFLPLLFFICDFERLSQSFIFQFLLRMWLTFWRKHSAFVSLLLFSKSVAHVSVTKIMAINNIFFNCWHKVQS